ncbi:hypothetical protein RR45_GL001193 [Lactococcus chungangensis CAU 28 = DSM 22330]|uniref:Lipoprotein n=1 Tax=Pseudolactococcus chungangensis CAU 28 = DSM 22330 TaxID=1122154 RepID=A0A1K2HJP0_9LACT|nr:hypothetical protein [Lactococcus chungangensis]PCS00864.1 hypothetical protein RR45_GL001193 [Lactococcus chungangensis CAU 28 = DSM 22330]SFZ76761.1 hypothetical protein SAMN02746068_02064 [Lactococcus chungangensis CAU 28 = DSM 22330]
MKLINVTVILLGVLLLTSCGKQADKTEGKKHTSTIQKKSKSQASSKSTSETTTEASSTSAPASSEIVIGEKQPVITSEVAGLPSDYLGKWVNHLNNDYFEITSTQLTTGNDVTTVTSKIVKVGKDREGYLVQTEDGISSYLTVKDNQLYPVTSQAELASDFLSQITFEKE